MHIPITLTDTAGAPPVAAHTEQPAHAARGLSARLGPYVLLGLLLAPSWGWIAADERVWPWDQAWYGEVSVELFYTLVYSPSEWPTTLGRAFAIKAPGIAWVGEWFVPLSGVLGATDRGLLLSVLLAQLGTLWLTYTAISSLCGANRGVALTGAVLIGSGPLFVGLTHQYVVEPLQTFVVAWFVFLMARAREFHPTVLLLHLVAATGLGMLAKVTSPLYCLGPGLVVLYEISRKYRRSGPAGDPVLRLHRVHAAAALLAALGFGLGALAWYWVNFASVVSFTMLAYSSPVAQLYGAHDTFANKLAYWLIALRTNFVYPLVAATGVPLVVLAVGRRLALDRLGRVERSVARLDLCMLIALLETLVVLASFSAGDNEENRYLMPLAPYLAVALAWLLVEIRSQWLTAAVGVLVFGQAAAVNAQALGFAAPSSDLSVWLYPIDRDVTHAREIDSLVDTICTPASKLRYTIVGVEEPWLNANTLAYVSARRHEPEHVRCYYTSLGYAEADTDRAWDRLNALNILFYATLAPNVRLSSPTALNQVSEPVLRRVEQSGTFDSVSVTDDTAVLLFKHRER